MSKAHFIGSQILVLALVGCSSSSTINVAESVYALGAALDTTEKAELAYFHSPSANAQIIAAIQKLDLEAYNAISPLVQNQNNVTTDEVLAAQAAISALTEYMIQNGVKS